MAVPTNITVAVANALAAQPWFIRRKDTLAALAGTALQLGNIAVVMTEGMPEYVGLIVAFVIGLAQVVFHAATKGAITPSMAERLEEVAPAAVKPHAETYGEARDRLAAETGGPYAD